MAQRMRAEQVVPHQYGEATRVDYNVGTRPTWPDYTPCSTNRASTGQTCRDNGSSGFTGHRQWRMHAPPYELCTTWKRPRFGGCYTSFGNALPMCPARLGGEPNDPPAPIRPPTPRTLWYPREGGSRNPPKKMLCLLPPPSPARNNKASITGHLGNQISGRPRPRFLQITA